MGYLELICTSSDNIYVDTAYCKVCRKFGVDRNISFVIGTNNIVKCSVKKHFESKKHQDALTISLAKQKSNEGKQNPFQRSLENMGKLDPGIFEKLQILFRTAFNIAIKERPFSDFVNDVECQVLNGVNFSMNQYVTDKKCREFIREIALHITDQIKQELSVAKVFSVLFDGSTDRADIEQELVMIRFIHDYLPVVRFVSLEALENAKANGVYSGVVNSLSNVTNDNWKEKLIGVGCDGANVNLGVRNSVFTRLQADVPWLIAIHCIAHRLELAFKTAFKDSYMNNVDDMLQSIYKFYKNSAKRQREVAQLASALDDCFEKLNKCTGTRWINHKLIALKKLRISYKTIVGHLEHYAEDNSNTGADRAKAVGYLWTLKTYKMVYFIHFMIDVLDEAGKLSLCFQRDDITVASATSKLESVMYHYLSFADHNGPYVQSFLTTVGDGTVYNEVNLTHQVQIPILKNEAGVLLDNLIAVLGNRLSNSEVCKACCIFDHSNLPTEDPQALRVYGNHEIETIVNTFTHLLQNSGFNNDDVTVITEWSSLKDFVRGRADFQALHPNSVWKYYATSHRAGEWSNILLLINLTQCFPLSTSCNERGFSTMKHIKSDWRANLNNDTLNYLMIIGMEGPKALRDFDPAPIVHRWWLSGERSRRSYNM